MSPLLLSNAIIGPMSTPETLASKFYEQLEFNLLTPTCRRCNGGWLGALESHAKNVLSPLIRGEPTRLTAEDQGVIARWALKTALLLDHRYHPAYRMVAPETYPLLRGGGAKAPPPANTEARIGIMGADPPFTTEPPFTVDLLMSSSMDVPGPRPAPRPVAFRFVLIVSHLLIEVTGSTADLPLKMPDLKEPDDSLIQIWPASGPVDWPPPHAFGHWEAQDLGLTVPFKFGFRNTINGVRPFLGWVGNTEHGSPLKKLQVGEIKRVPPKSLIARDGTALTSPFEPMINNWLAAIASRYPDSS